MEDQITIFSERRDVLGKKVKASRRQGKLPAVLYGFGVDSIPVFLNHREASKKIQGLTSSSLVTIKLEDEEHTALVREKQYDVIKGTLLHVDFLLLSLTETVRAEVTILVTGKSPAVQSMGGIVTSVLDRVEVDCLPQDLPENLTVDISGLESIGDSIMVRDLVVSPNVNILSTPEDLVVVITAPEVEVEEEEEELEEDLELEGEPEVISRGKDEEEEAE